MRVLLVGAHDGDDDLGLVAEAVGERRAQRPVDQAAVEDGEIGRAPLTAEERAGDLARGVHALFDVDGEREEVDALTDALGGVGGDEHVGVADLGDDRALGLLGELAGLEREGLVGAATAPDTEMASAIVAPLGRSCAPDGLLRRGQFPVVGVPTSVPEAAGNWQLTRPRRSAVQVVVGMASLSGAGRAWR